MLGRTFTFKFSFQEIPLENKDQVTIHQIKVNALGNLLAWQEAQEMIRSQYGRDAHSMWVA